MYFAQKEDTISVFPRLCLPALAPEGKTTSSSKLFTMQTSLTKLKKKNSTSVQDVQKHKRLWRILSPQNAVSTVFIGMREICPRITKIPKNCPAEQIIMAER